MSGLEIAGIAASILQIAEIGTQLAVKLCGFYHKLKTADQYLQNLSNNVALTSTVLRLLGDNLRKDDQGKLYSTEAFSTTQRVLNECKNVFTQIGDSIDQNQNSAGGKTRMRMQRAAKRVNFVVTREQELELLATNLERLKSTLHLMLNVIMYAGQLRSRDEPAALKSQRDLLQTLLEHKNQTEKRFDDLNARLKAPVLSEARSPEARSQDPLRKIDDKELEGYCSLVRRLLNSIEECGLALEQPRVRRVNAGVMRFHSEEIDLIKNSYGGQMPEFIKDTLHELSNLFSSEKIGDMHGIRERAARIRPIPVEVMYCKRPSFRPPTSYDQRRVTQSREPLKALLERARISRNAERTGRPDPKHDNRRPPKIKPKPARLRSTTSARKAPSGSENNRIPEPRKRPETHDRPEESTRLSSSSGSSQSPFPASAVSSEDSRVTEEVKRHRDEQTPIQALEDIAYRERRRTAAYSIIQETDSDSPYAQPAKHEADMEMAESREESPEGVSDNIDALVLSWTTVGGDEMRSAYG